MAYYFVIRLRNDGDQEVQQHYQNNELIHKPKEPDSDRSKVGDSRVFMSDAQPKAVVWRCNVSDGVSVCLNELLECKCHMWIISSININANQVPEERKESNSKGQLAGKRHDVDQALLDESDESVEYWEHSCVKDGFES